MLLLGEDNKWVTSQIIQMACLVYSASLEKLKRWLCNFPYKWPELILLLRHFLRWWQKFLETYSTILKQSMWRNSLPQNFSKTELSSLQNHQKSILKPRASRRKILNILIRRKIMKRRPGEEKCPISILKLNQLLPRLLFFLFQWCITHLALMLSLICFWLLVGFITRLEILFSSLPLPQLLAVASHFFIFYFFCQFCDFLGLPVPPPTILFDLSYFLVWF